MQDRERKKIQVDKFHGSPFLWDCTVKIVAGDVTVPIEMTVTLVDEENKIEKSSVGERECNVM